MRLNPSPVVIRVQLWRDGSWLTYQAGARAGEWLGLRLGLRGSDAVPGLLEAVCAFSIPTAAAKGCLGNGFVLLTFGLGPCNNSPLLVDPETPTQQPHRAISSMNPDLLRRRTPAIYCGSPCFSLSQRGCCFSRWRRGHPARGLP